MASLQDVSEVAARFAFDIERSEERHGRRMEVRKVRRKSAPREEANPDILRKAGQHVDAER